MLLMGVSLPIGEKWRGQMEFPSLSPLSLFCSSFPDSSLCLCWYRKQAHDFALPVLQSGDTAHNVQESREGWTPVLKDKAWTL